MITRKELIRKYIEFFKKKGHKEIENSSLIPKGDPTVLFTTAGMHPLVPYLLGQTHPQGKRLVNVQRCLRTGDIHEVGDTAHHTFFEMLGNWSLGDYWKKEAIEMSLEFLTKELKIPKEKLAITYFEGDKNTQKDIESKEIWKNLGIDQKKIQKMGKEDNWWGPAGTTGPCGPDTEMFYWKSSKKVPERFNPNDSTLATNIDSDWVEIWNDVFMEYEKNSKGEYKKAKQKNVDTGMGVERTLAALNNIEDNYLTEVWKPIIDEIEHLYGIKYGSEKNKKLMRIVADHTKAAVFIAAEEIIPSNKEHGYVLRRLIRRAYVKLYRLGNTGDLISPLIDKVIEIYSGYPLLIKNKKHIYKIINEEERKFEETLGKGLTALKKMTIKDAITGEQAFLLQQSYGFPIEMTEELAMEWGVEVDIKGFQEELKKHQELSRTSAEGRFKSGLADHSEATTKLHTAHHLLLAALRKVLGDEVLQRGSNITPERLRLDFSFPRKLTDQEIKQVENLVNEQIKKGLQINSEQKSPSQALKEGALGVFGDKYGEVISVYTMGNFSKEICTGPHVKNTKELGHFKILKEESSSQGVRRIKAILE